MYKLIAIDLDGTLLNSYGQISTKNKESIERAMKQGTEVVLASGRPISSVRSFANELGTNNYIICGNGSILYDLNTEKILYDKSIDKQKALQIVKICEENSIFYNIYTEDLVIAKSLNYNVMVYNNENQSKMDDKKTNIKIVTDIYKYIEESKDINILKITICDDNEIIFGGIIRKLIEIKDIDVLDVSHMARKTIKTGTEEVKVEYFYTEITSKNVNKWNALQKLGDLLNIKSDEMVAIGDNINDKEMIQSAGLGIIMGNSAPYMKQFADAEVSDNNTDGVSEAIEKFIIKE